MYSEINESGMVFVADNALYIEKSDLYASLGNCVRSVEFVRAKDEKLLFVEAKTSFANPNNPNAKNVIRFQSEIDEVCEKFIHSLNLFSSVKIGVSGNAFDCNLVLPKSISLVFILVIQNHESKWCKQIQNRIKVSLPKYIIKIWKPVIYVINREIAIKRELVVV